MDGVAPSTQLTRSALVDFIQNQLSLISSSVSITHTTSKLTPLRGALQAAVALHAIVTIYEGLRTGEEERMTEYICEITNNDSYVRILPESVLALFTAIRTSLQDDVVMSEPESTPSLQEENTLQQPEPSPCEDPAPTTIIVNETLLQQLQLLQYVRPCLFPVESSKCSSTSPSCVAPPPTPP